ncbi:MAG TPA: nitroreductase family deazaflavin-dependent oxidoreductase [Actinobacteria bacterium]|nr:deazaflavin-dependent nitroreductase [bacterium BMS3Bbin01]HDH25906.1 nitroreductase family deazaflavin-dependent oxidoreductase [Actinomycetota bacterium]
MRDRTAKCLSAVHAAAFHVTRGRLGRRLVRNDILLLTTRGRKSGRPHTVPLLYLRSATALVVIASWGGRPANPDWYENLMASPRATVELPGGQTFDVSARAATPEERASWWPRITDAYAGYVDYQSQTDREIPVVFLTPTT